MVDCVYAHLKNELHESIVSTRLLWCQCQCRCQPTNAKKTKSLQLKNQQKRWRHPTDHTTLTLMTTTNKILCLRLARTVRIVFERKLFIISDNISVVGWLKRRKSRDRLKSTWFSCFILAHVCVSIWALHSMIFCRVNEKPNEHRVSG